jgi:hypothetical protein
MKAVSSTTTGLRVGIGTPVTFMESLGIAKNVGRGNSATFAAKLDSKIRAFAPALCINE